MNHGCVSDIVHGCDFRVLVDTEEVSDVHRGAEGAVLKRRLGIEHIRTVVSHVGIGNIERSERVIVIVNVRALHQNAVGNQGFFGRLEIALHLRLLNFHLCGSAAGKGRKRAGRKSNRHRNTQP